MATNTQDGDPSESTDSAGETEKSTMGTETGDDGSVTRRAAMALAGVTGAGLLAGGAGQVGASGKPKPVSGIGPSDGPYRPVDDRR